MTLRILRALNSLRVVPPEIVKEQAVAQHRSLRLIVIGGVGSEAHYV